MYHGSIVQTLPTLFKCEWDVVHNYSIASPGEGIKTAHPLANSEAVSVSKGTIALVYFLKISGE